MYQYLRSLFPNGRGIGGFFGRLVTEHRVRRELAEHYRAISSKEQWESDGVCID
jgi:hypothetical protein